MKENHISRRNFLRGASAVAMASVLPGSMKAASVDEVKASEAAPAERKGPKRGVSFYSYSAEWELMVLKFWPMLILPTILILQRSGLTIGGHCVVNMILCPLSMAIGWIAACIKIVCWMLMRPLSF